ncbi:hypothetical protein QYF61_026530 [Mycteria americana]|uniref:MGT5A-like N-terminal domain-containing protein n=1 Tax=Mycteria americana TaxID=33587 RepID=A0AAN7RV61_MYCAM|nr:hypothetical protein QYF61_026530 [Mycteria americana]
MNLERKSVEISPLRSNLQALRSTRCWFCFRFGLRKPLGRDIEAAYHQLEESEEGQTEEEMRVHKKLGGDTARTADPNWPKGYSIPYGVMLNIETGGSWLGGSNCCLGTGWALITSKPMAFQQHGGYNVIDDRNLCSNCVKLLGIMAFSPWKLSSQKLGFFLVTFGFIWGMMLLHFTIQQQTQHESSSVLREQILDLSKRYIKALAEENKNVVDGPYVGTVTAYESQNRIGWKRPLRSSSPTVNLTLPSPPLYHVPKHLIQTDGDSTTSLGSLFQCLITPFSELKFPNSQSKTPLVQLEAISSRPITCYLGEETDPRLSTTSFQVVVESDKVSPQPPFLQAKQPQFPQPLLIRLLLQTLHQLRCPSLDTLQPLNVSLVVRGPKLNTVFENLVVVEEEMQEKDFVLAQSCPFFWEGDFCFQVTEHLTDYSSDNLKKTLAVLLDNILQRIGKLESKVENLVLNGTGANSTNNTSTPAPSLGAVEKLNVAVLEGCYKVSPQPSLLQAEQSQFSQPVLVGEVLQPSDHFCGPPLDPLQQLHVLLVLRAPELDALLQDVAGLLGCERTLSAHVQLFVHQYPRALFPRAALDHIIPQPVLKPRTAPTQVWDPALGLVEPHEVHTGPLLQLVQVPLDDIPSFWRVSCTTQLGVICKLAEGALNLTVNVIDENIEQHWFQYRPLRDTTPVDCYPLDVTIQPIPYPLNSPPIKSVSPQFREKDVVGDRCSTKQNVVWLWKVLGNVSHKVWGGPDKHWTGRCYNLECHAKIIHYKLLHEEPMPDSSKTDPPLAKAEPISDGGSTSGITHLRQGKSCCATAAAVRREE